MGQIIFFLILTVPITLFSRPWLAEKSAHGFYRYFVFESILALVLLNAPFWFRESLSLWLVLSWMALAISLGLLVDSVYLLKVIGKPSGSIENTTKLVRVGVYRFIRHPLYSSLLWLAWGAYLKDFSILGTLLTAVATICLVLTARAEEAENIAKFGAEYLAYMSESKRFVPLIY